MFSRNAARRARSSSVDGSAAPIESLPSVLPDELKYTARSAVIGTSHDTFVDTFFPKPTTSFTSTVLLLWGARGTVVPAVSPLPIMNCRVAVAACSCGFCSRTYVS